MSVLKKIALLLFILVILGFLTGIYFIAVADNELVGNKFVGFSILVSVFILVPIFLYIRFKGKKLKDYTLTKDNIERWREELNKRQN